MDYKNQNTKERNGAFVVLAKLKPKVQNGTLLNLQQVAISLVAAGQTQSHLIMPHKNLL